MRAVTIAGPARPVAPAVSGPGGASQRVLTVPGEMGTLLPGGGVSRGAVVAVEGPLGSGGTSVLLRLAAAATVAGEWAAVVVGTEDGALGAVAAAEAGVALERLAVVRRVPPGQWASVVAALVEGVSLVVTCPPRRLGPAEAARLAARVRQHRAVLAVAGEWPAGAALVIRARRSSWHGLEQGHITGRTLRVEVEPRGRLPRPAALAG